jgi:hypothetical protein
MKLNVVKVVKGNYLSGEIFKDGSEVNRSTGTNTFSVFSGLKEPSDTANGKLKTSFATP